MSGRKGYCDISLDDESEMEGVPRKSPPTLSLATLESAAAEARVVTLRFHEMAVHAQPWASEVSNARKDFEARSDRARCIVCNVLIRNQLWEEHDALDELIVQERITVQVKELAQLPAEDPEPDCPFPLEKKKDIKCSRMTSRKPR